MNQVVSVVVWVWSKVILHGSKADVTAHVIVARLLMLKFEGERELLHMHVPLVES